MIARKIISFTLIFHITLCTGQMRERFYRNDLKLYNLNGKVKDVKHIEYEPQYNTNDSTYVLKIFDFLSMKNYISTFNRSGYLEKKVELHFDLKDSMSVSAIWTYNYDKKNRIIREFKDFKRHGDTSSWNYSYNKNSTLIKYYQKDYHVLYYKYSQINNVELLTTANADSSYQRKIKFIYDKRNRLVRYENYEDKDSILNLRILRYDDTSYNYISETNEDKKYKFTNNMFYKYDKYGNKIKAFNEEQKLTGYFEYIYDRKKNWIEKKCYNSRGHLYNVHKRDITYY